MKTESQVNDDILNTIVEIKSKYPELSKYLEEMPITDNKFKVVTVESLQEYYNSLKTLLKKYDNEHNEKDTSKKSITEEETLNN